MQIILVNPEFNVKETILMSTETLQFYLILLSSTPIFFCFRLLFCNIHEKSADFLCCHNMIKDQDETINT